MKNQNTENAQNAQSTMRAVKRAKAVVVYDKNNNAKLVSVTNESESEYKLANKKTVEKEKAVANISKNRFNTYVSEDRQLKSYHSHIESFKDVHELYLLVKELFDDATETQYFVFCKEKSIKLRIQRNAVEIMSKALKERENAEQCSNAKDFAKYDSFLTATNTETVKEILNSLK